MIVHSLIGVTISYVYRRDFDYTARFIIPCLIDEIS